MNRNEFEMYISTNYRLSPDAIDYVFLKTNVYPVSKWSNIHSDDMLHAETALEFESEEFARFCLVIFKTMPLDLFEGAKKTMTEK